MWGVVLAAALVLAACGEASNVDATSSADSPPTVDSTAPPPQETTEATNEESIESQPASTTSTTAGPEEIVTPLSSSDEPDIDREPSEVPEELELLRDTSPGPRNDGDGPELFDSTFDLETLDPVDLDVLPDNLLDISLRSLDIFPFHQSFGDPESTFRESGRPVIRFTPDQDAIQTTFTQFSPTPESAAQVSELLGIAEAAGEPALSEELVFFACSLEGVCSSGEVTINYLPSSLGIPITLPDGHSAQEDTE